MKSRKLQDAIGMIDPKFVVRAAETPAVVRRRLPKWVVLVAAMLAVVILTGTILAVLRPDDEGVLPVGENPYAILTATYPTRVKYVENNSEVYRAWQEELRAKRQYYGNADDLTDFFATTVPVFLSDSNGQNRVYSPLNVYMALAMLAEVSDGTSRAEILTLLGVDSIETLRIKTHAIWNTAYRDDGVVTTILGNSLWLNEDLQYNRDVLEILQTNYYASSFQGQMGSPDFNRALRTWLNEQTGGMLEKYVNAECFDPIMAMAIVSTLYFKASWSSGFGEKNNTVEPFYAQNGAISCTFMNKSWNNTYYWGEKFTATTLSLDQGGSVYFILPDQGVSLEELLRDSETLSFITTRSKWEQSREYRINLSMPKFDVDSGLDLAQKLKELGVESCFDLCKANFSPLLGAQPAFVSKVSQNARVKVDEDGIEAAAYTIIAAPGGAAPDPEIEEIDFVLDRPFLFVITGDDGLPLFVGTVYNP